MKALISKDNKVLEVVDVEFPVHPDLRWVDCPDTCKFGHDYQDGKFSEPHSYDSAEQKALEQEVNLKIDKVNALWDFIKNNDRTKLDAMILQEENI